MGHESRSHCDPRLGASTARRRPASSASTRSPAADCRAAARRCWSAGRAPARRSSRCSFSCTARRTARSRASSSRSRRPRSASSPTPKASAGNSRSCGRRSCSSSTRSPTPDLVQSGSFDLERHAGGARGARPRRWARGASCSTRWTSCWRCCPTRPRSGARSTGCTSGCWRSGLTGLITAKAGGDERELRSASSRSASCSSWWTAR